MARLIKLLGEPSIRDEQGADCPVRGHQAWGLLARVLLSPRPLSRRILAMELFPDTVDPLGSVRWCLASLRKALDCPDCLRGDPIDPMLPDGIRSDIQELDREDLEIDDFGQLLEGVTPRCSEEFSTWLLIERERIAAVVGAKLRREAVQAIALGDHFRGAKLAEIGIKRDPYDEGFRVLLVKSLVLAGRTDAAQDHIRATETLFAEELGEKPSSALRNALRRPESHLSSRIAPAAIVRSSVQSGLAALSAGAVETGIESLRGAADEAGRTGDAHLLATATLELGKALVHSVRGHDEEGIVLLRRCAEVSERNGYSDFASAAWTELGYVEALAGRRPTAASYLERALEHASGACDLARVYSVSGFNLADWGRIGEALDHYQRALDHAEAAQNRRRQIWALGIGAWALLSDDQTDRAHQWLTTCLKLVDEQGWLAFRPWPVALLAEIELRRGGDAATVRTSLEEALVLSCQLRDPCWEGIVARNIGLTYAAQGDLDQALDWLYEARRRACRETDVFAALNVSILATLTDISSRLGKEDLVSAFSREWIAQAARCHMDGHVAKAAGFIAGAPKGAHQRSLARAG